MSFFTDLRDSAESGLNNLVGGKLSGAVSATAAIQPLSNVVIPVAQTSAGSTAALNGWFHNNKGMLMLVGLVLVVAGGVIWLIRKA